MENLIDRTLKHIKARREKVLKGGVNCIPSPFKRFRKDFVGIEQKKYYLITAHEKSGKTQMFSFLFLYTDSIVSYLFQIARAFLHRIRALTALPWQIFL